MNNRKPSTGAALAMAASGSQMTRSSSKLPEVCFVCGKKKRDLLKCTNPHCGNMAHSDDVVCSAYTTRAQTEENMLHSGWFCSGSCFAVVNPPKYRRRSTDSDVAGAVTQRSVHVGLAVVDGMVDKRFRVYRELYRRQFDVFCLTHTRCYQVDTQASRKRGSHGQSIGDDLQQPYSRHYFACKHYDVHIGSDQSAGGGVVIYTRRPDGAHFAQYECVYNDRLCIERAQPSGGLMPFAVGLPSLANKMTLKPILVDIMLLKHTHYKFVIGVLYRHTDVEKPLEQSEIGAMLDRLTCLLSQVLSANAAVGLVLAGTFNLNYDDADIGCVFESSLQEVLSLSQLVSKPTHHIDMTALELLSKASDGATDSTDVMMTNLHTAFLDADAIHIFRQLERTVLLDARNVRLLHGLLDQHSELASLIRAFAAGYCLGEGDERALIELSLDNRVEDAPKNPDSEFGHSYECTSIGHVPALEYNNTELQDYEMSEHVRDFDENFYPHDQRDVDCLFDNTNLAAEWRKDDNGAASRTFVGLEVDGGPTTNLNKNFEDLNGQEREQDVQQMRDEVAVSLEESHQRAIGEMSDQTDGGEASTSNGKKEAAGGGKFQTKPKAEPECSDLIFAGPPDVFNPPARGCQPPLFGQLAAIERRAGSQKDARHAMVWVKLTVSFDDSWTIRAQQQHEHREQQFNKYTIIRDSNQCMLNGSMEEGCSTASDLSAHR